MVGITVAGDREKVIVTPLSGAFKSGRERQMLYIVTHVEPKEAELKK